MPDVHAVKYRAFCAGPARCQARRPVLLSERFGLLAVLWSGRGERVQHLVPRMKRSCSS